MMRPDLARRIAELERRQTDTERLIREMKARMAMLKDRARFIRMTVK